MSVQPQRKRAAHLGPERRRPLILDTAYRALPRAAASRGPRWTRSRAPPASRSRSSTTASPPRTSSSARCSTARRSGSSPRPSARCETGGGVADPEGTLIRGYQAFLQAVADSPARPTGSSSSARAARNEAVATRISRGLERQAAAAAAIARTLGRPLLGPRGGRCRGRLRAARPDDRRARPGRRPDVAAKPGALDATDARREARADGLGSQVGGVAGQSSPRTPAGEAEDVARVVHRRM